jgi:hypothetical protein
MSVTAVIGKFLNFTYKYLACLRFVQQNRPWSDVPKKIKFAFFVVLLLQLATAAFRSVPQAKIIDLPAAIQPSALKLLALGDENFAHRLGLQWLQAYDVQPGVAISFKDLPTEHLTAWLDSFQELDPNSDYPIFLVAEVYFSSGSEVFRRALVPWIRKSFYLKPDTRWRYLARVAILVKHKLNDAVLAIDLARDIRVHSAASAPDWARQLDAFLLESIGEDEASAALLATFLRDGLYRDEQEARFLAGRLKELHTRIEEKSKLRR